MPKTTLTPLPGKQRRKRVAARVSAAVSMDEALYHRALRRAETHAENNFSAYVRSLIRRDLGGASAA